MARPKRENRRTIVYRKRALSRKVKHRTIKVVSRKGQPQVTIEAPAMKKQQLELAGVASSWISNLAYDKGLGYATMMLLDGHVYTIKMPFKVFEEWYYAHSKGTFFNERLKDNYTVRRLR